MLSIFKTAMQFSVQNFDVINSILLDLEKIFIVFSVSNVLGTKVTLLVDKIKECYQHVNVRSGE